MIKQKKYLIPAAALTFIGVALFLYFRISPSSGKFYKIRRGNLEVVVSSKGEINGEKYTEINLPEILCNQELRVYQLKIIDVILEGKEVKRGDYIAKLDDGMYANMMQDVIKQKEVQDADMRNALIDSAVILNAKREDINNARLDLEYLKIDLEQSKFESQAYQRKTQMQYEKGEIGVEKLKRDYQLERNRLKMRVGRYQDRVAYYQSRIDKYKEALAATTIKAPEDGILMFAKDWSGKSYGKDTEINIWRPLIATLPDMSVAVTETYIREIDISKVNLNDSVRILVDALPDRVFWGKVVKIATIGEDHRDFDMKAFKIVIRLDKTDPDMKPGMSCNNDIIVDSYRDKILIPLKAIYSKNGKKIVYLKQGGDISEHEIETEAENEEFAVVENSVKEGDVVLLYQPEEFKAEKEKVAER
jgi:multidrug efflux pump subunit AcrA (membrane-fusion protein)